MKESKRKKMIPKALLFFTLAALLAAVQGVSGQDDKIQELEAFIAEETATEASDSILPTSREVDAVYGSMNVMDIPRSVTVLTPEAMKQFNIDDFGDLDKVGAGTQRVNFYGVPGAPFLRGDLAGTYFNGMQRAFNRNDMPVSFGSLEALDLVKGPAPSHFGPTQAGGYANFVPKSPYFDEFRGSLKLTIGTYDYYRIQADTGGPFLLGGKPAAFRISLTAQEAESYYDDLRNDFISFYGSMKVKLRDGVTIFTGGEYFNFNSNENPGWNRPTQDLINNGNYIIGEPADQTSPLWDNTFPKTDSPFVIIPSSQAESPVAFGANPALVVPRGIVEGANLPSSTLSLLEDLGEEGYRYTLDYLNDPDAIVFTTKLDGSEVLTDPSDFADSEDFLFFFDFKNARNDDFIIKNQILFEYLETAKISSYGYAFAIEQLVMEEKLTFDKSLGNRSNVVFGASIRYSDALQLQDFDTEPFGRRDISRDSISGNSVIKVGPQRVPLTGDDRNLWATNVSANADSELFQGGVFAYMTNNIGDQFTLITSVRGEYSSWESGIPAEVERSAQAGVTTNDEDKWYFMASTSPVFRVAPGVSLYGSVQIGTAFNPTQGGAVTAGEGDVNFAESELYEAGIKMSLLEGSLYATVAGYHWDKSRFEERTGTATRQRSKGVEMELTYLASEHLSFTAGFTASRSHRRDEAGFRFADAGNGFWLPLVAGGLYAGGSAGRPVNNPDLILNGFPEVTANLYGNYKMENGLSFGFGALWRDTYYHNFDRTLVLPSTVILRATAGYTSEKWDILLTVENLASEDYFTGSDPIFGANAILTKGPEATGQISFTYKF